MKGKTKWVVIVLGKMKIYNTSGRVVFVSSRFDFLFSRPCVFSCYKLAYICASSCSIHAQYGGLGLNSYPALCSRFKFVPSRAVFVFISYPFHMLSCSVRIPHVFYLCGVWRLRVNFVSSRAVFVFISYSFHVASCSVRFALVFHFCWFWKNRVEFVSSRAVVVIIPYTFQAVSCSVRNRLCFFYVGCGKLVSNSYPVVRCSCFFRILLMRCRVQSRILLLFHLMWGPEISCQVRIHSCGVFMFSSYPACVSFMWGLKSSWQSRIQSCAFVFISYYSPVFSKMFSSTVRIPLVFNSCVVREFILNSCRALFAYSFQIRFQS